MDSEVLRQLYCEECWPVAAIARCVRRRKADVLAMMDAAGIARRRPGRVRRPLPDWDREKLRALVKVRGHAYVRAFAQMRGVNREKLAVLLGRRALDRGQRSRQRAVLFDDDVRAAYDSGVPVGVLAECYGCTRRTISRSLDRTSGGTIETFR